MFQAHEIAMQLIVAVRPIVEAVRPHDKNLAEQLRRAATSAAANTAEGGRRATAFTPSASRRPRPPRRSRTRASPSPGD